jgi:L-lactate dehydrogenase complex protein LldG
MTSSRDRILNKLRAARQPFPDAPPRPKQYAPVTHIDPDATPDERLARFQEAAPLVEVFAVRGDKAACKKIVELLKSHKASHILAWHFTHIPVRGLKAAINDAGIKVTQPDVQDEFRMETIENIRDADVGLTGVDAVAVTTGTLVVSTGKGKGRIPTVLPPVYIAVATLDQVVGQIEDWVATQRATGLETIRNSANVCFITGPSATGDIEMEMVLGVHGPGKVQLVVKR